MIIDVHFSSELRFSAKDPFYNEKKKKNNKICIISRVRDDAIIQAATDAATKRTIPPLSRTIYHMRKVLSKQKRKDIESLIRKGQSERVICSRLGVSRKSVENKRKKMGDAPYSRKGGRKQVLAAAAKRKCDRLYSSGECDTISEVTTAISTELNKPISRYTVARALADSGVTSKKKKKACCCQKKTGRRDSLLLESTSIGRPTIGGR